MKGTILSSIRKIKRKIIVMLRKINRQFERGMSYINDSNFFPPY